MEVAAMSALGAQERKWFSVWRLACLLCCCCSLRLPVCSTAQWTSSAGQGGTRERRVPDEQRLYETIMGSYQQSVMPQVTNVSHTLTVAFSLRLNQIVTLDERKQVLTTNVFIDQTWIDPALAWDPHNFTDVRALRIPAEHVWLPDTFVYNNADGGSSGFMRGTYVQIQSNGRVLWPVPLRLRSSCSVRITYFPFDSQICTLRFGSWIYGQRQLDYTPLTDGLTVDPSSYVNNSEWELVSFTMTKATSPSGGQSAGQGPHPHLTYVLHLKRNTFFYLFNIIVPCVMLSTLNILTFWLPPVSGEKITLGLSVFLAFSMFMLLIAEEVPATSEAVPLIGVYLCMVMTMTSLSVMMAVVVTNLYHRGRKMRPAPRWLVTLCLRWLARPFSVPADIAIIASTVDLTEHCQYDFSHKRQSQPYVVHNIINNNSTDLLTTPSPNSNRSSPRHRPLLPTHLQNGGNVSRDAHSQAGAPREGEGTSACPDPAAAACGGPVTSVWRGERRVSHEVHPRARNSVTTSCHFTKLPTAVDSDHDDDDDVWVTRSDDDDEEEEEEKEIWQRNVDLDRASLNEDDDDEESQVSRSLLATSPDTPSPSPHHHLHHLLPAGDPARGSEVRTATHPTLTLPGEVGLCVDKLDPHPSSSDLQAARTMIAEWQQIATVVDRLMFVLYVLITLTAYVIILLIVPAKQPPVNDAVLKAAANMSAFRHWGG